MLVDLAFDKTLCSRHRTFTLKVALQSAAQRIVIHGPSGSGKSMTLRTIAGLLAPDAGHVCVNGRTLFDSTQGIDLPTQARQVGYLFQDYALFPHLTVRQNIAFGLNRHWLPTRRTQHDERVDYWLAAFQLEGLCHHHPHELSGGQRQRTALARTLVTQPQILLLDEPFAALDQALRDTLRAELDAVQRRLDIPMILITHDREDVAAFGDDVFHMDNGIIVR